MNAHAHPFSRGVIFDRDIIRDHLATIHGLAAGIDGLLVLSVFGEDPQTGREEKFPVEKFIIGDVDEMVAAVMRYEMRPHANIYVGLHVMRRDLESGRRGGLKDIVAVLGLVADMDADTGKNKGEMPVEPSLVLESSPGNRQAFIFFDKPMMPEEAHELAKALKAATGGDYGTGDVAHVWRMAGTLNYPSAVKVKERGRSIIPAPVHVLGNSGQVYAAEALRDALAPYMPQPKDEQKANTDAEQEDGVQFEETSLPPILFGHITRGVAVGQRSHKFMHVVGWLKDIGWNPEAIEKLLARYPNGIAQKYNGRLRREIDRCFDKAEDRTQQPNADGKQRHDESEQIEEQLEELNKKYCVIPDGGKTRVLSFRIDSQQKHHRREVPVFMSFQDFRHLYSNRKVRIGDRDVPLGTWWTNHPKRRQYAGITFEPGAGEEVAGQLNLWRGWNLEPQPGDWSRMRRHIDEVLAAGDPLAAKYILNWVAWAFQHPDQRAEVALVFRRQRGTGKGTLGNSLCRIFGQHATHISCGPSGRQIQRAPS